MYGKIGLYLLLSFSSIVYCQVEIPNTNIDCRPMKTNKFNYCIGNNSYLTIWTAIKIEKEDIENHIYIPSDKEFFPELKQFSNTMWNTLENQVKYWAIEFDSVFVVTGSFMVEDSSDNQSNKNYYKAILKGCKGDAIGFIMNINQPSEELLSYAVSIDSLEVLTGYDFFPELSPDLQLIIESQFNVDFWQVSIP